jgi:hypothetical protein
MAKNRHTSRKSRTAKKRQNGGEIPVNQPKQHRPLFPKPNNCNTKVQILEKKIKNLEMELNAAELISGAKSNMINNERSGIESPSSIPATIPAKKGFFSTLFGLSGGRKRKQTKRNKRN